jgi:leucyl/phenylalanyl-tRNA--protein transferase
VFHVSPAPPVVPVEPPPSRLRFPDPRRLGEDEDVVGIGEDLSPGTLLAAYRKGIFPWPHGSGVLPWFSPDPRANFLLDRPPHWSRSLRRTLRKNPFTITRDRAFVQVMRLCGETRPDGTWITGDMLAGYAELFALGWCHSVEVWEGDELVGGIYGVAVGGLFAGESMFHTRTDASKLAFASLVEHLRARGYVLFDVQVMNDHLASLGCVEASRTDYLDQLEHALRVPATW